MSTSLTFDILARDRASDKFDHVGKSASGAGDKLKKFAKVGAMAVAAGALVAGKALVDMTKAAMEDEAAQRVLAVSMKNAAGANGQQVKAVEAWISAQGKAKGIADDELRPAMARLVQATGDVGKSQRLASLAMDVSAGTGKSLKSVTDALAKAQTGSLGGLSKMGVATKNVDGSTKSLAEVTKELAAVHEGQASKAANTTEGKFKRLKVMFDETKESIGARLIPIAGQLADWFMNKLVPAAGKVGDWIKEKLLPPIRDFAESVAPKARDVVNAMKGAFSDAEPFIRLVGKVVTNVVVPGLKKLAEVAGPVLVAQIKLVGKGLEAIGKAGTWMWNNALQPAFKFITKGIGNILNGFSSMLDAMSNVPGFGWAKDAAVAMGKAADKALAISAGLKKIPPNKKVYVTVVTKYTGLRSTTRGGGGDDGINPEDYLPRGGIRNAQAAGVELMSMLADGIRKGGKKLDEVLATSRDRIKDAFSGIRDEMGSLSESVASAINQTDFSGGIAELMASLTGNGGALSGLQNVFATLKDSVSKGFLSSLMQSGNVGLATALANDPAAAAAASAQYDANAAMANGLGDQTAQQVLGDRFEKALADEIKKLLEELRSAPDKHAKKLRKELEQLRLVVEGLDAGKRAHLQGAW